MFIRAEQHISNNVTSTSRVSLETMPEKEGKKLENVTLNSDQIP